MSVTETETITTQLFLEHWQTERVFINTESSRHPVSHRDPDRHALEAPAAVFAFRYILQVTAVGVKQPPQQWQLHLGPLYYIDATRITEENLETLWGPHAQKEDFDVAKDNMERGYCFVKCRTGAVQLFSPEHDVIFSTK